MPLAGQLIAGSILTAPRQQGSPSLPTALLVSAQLEAKIINTWVGTNQDARSNRAMNGTTCLVSLSLENVEQAPIGVACHVSWPTLAGAAVLFETARPASGSGGERAKLDGASERQQRKFWRRCGVVTPPTRNRNVTAA